jgi:hypothetical protein
MGNKLYVTKVPTPNFKIMHPDNTVICQVKISRAAMKAAQEAAKKQQKAGPVKGEKIIFSNNQKHQLSNWCFFLSFAVLRS